MPARILLVAPMLGGQPGRVPDVFERLGPLLAADGHNVSFTSSRSGSVARSADMVLTTARSRRGGDVVVIHLYTGRSFLVEDVVSRVVGRRATVGVLAGGGMPTFAERHPRWVRSVLGRFDVLVAPSEFLARWARSTVAARVETIPNPLDPGEYTFRLRDEPQPSLLWLRAYHQIYAPEIAVLVVDRLRGSLPGVRLTMVGADKGERSSVERLVAERGLGDRVEVRGFADEGEKRRLFASHDVFLNTSRVDNRPVSVVEAAAAGLCIVSTDVGGLPDLLTDGATGLLVAPDSPSAMADAVTRLVTSPGLAAHLSAGAGLVAAEGDPGTVVDRWSRLLDDIAPGAGQ